MIKQIKDLSAATLDDLNDNCQFIIDDSNYKTKKVSFNVLKQKIGYKEEILSLIYPIGSIYTTITNSDTCPFEGVDGVHWEKIASGKCLFGADENHTVSSEIEAGLPNIKGQINGAWFNHHTGAFADIVSGGQLESGDDWGQGNIIEFNASKYNSIYSDSVTTVQPPAIAVIFWQRVS